jgi:STIMATE family
MASATVSWTDDSFMYLIAVFVMKYIVIALIATFHFLITWGHWLLDPLQGTREQIVVVLFIIPLVMNIIQAWMTDVVIKASAVRSESEADLLTLETNFDNVVGLEEDSEEEQRPDSETSWTRTLIRLMFRRTPAEYTSVSEYYFALVNFEPDCLKEASCVVLRKRG